MAIFHIDHILADFDRWLSFFVLGDPRLEIERALGVETVRVLRNTEEPGHAIVVMRAGARDAIERMLDDHRPADFETFRDRLLARKITPDVKPIKLLRDIEDRNHVRLVVLAPDKAALERTMEDPRLQNHFADRRIFLQAPKIVFSSTSVYP